MDNVAGSVSGTEGDAPPVMSFESPLSRPPRSAALTGLRGAACLLALLSDLWIIVPGRTLERAGPLYGLFRSGNLGVDIFMVLGGFLLTRSLLHDVAAQGSATPSTAAPMSATCGISVPNSTSTRCGY